MRFLPVPMRFLFRPFICGILLALLAQIGAAHAQVGPPSAPNVVVATSLAREITLWDEYIGRFEAREQVEVRARVSGFLDKLHFKDGQIITKGDLLFTIDQRPFLPSSVWCRWWLPQGQGRRCDNPSASPSSPAWWG